MHDQAHPRTCPGCANGWRKCGQLVGDSHATFDASRLSEDLQELLSSARLRSDARPEMRQLLILLGRAEFKRGELARGARPPDRRAGDRCRDGRRCQRAHAGPLFPRRRGRRPQELSDGRRALRQGGRSFPRRRPDFDANQKLGIRERFAFALHEAKRYDEAYAANLAVLEDAGRLFGADDHRLSTVLINTAQNLYALKKLAEAQTYLRRALDIAQARSDIEREQDLLYQLAVLASEQGRAAEARGYLAERVERLEKRGPAKLEEAARRSLEHFDRNRARAGVDPPIARSSRTASTDTGRPPWRADRGGSRPPRGWAARRNSAGTARW